jgi:hypothetical protein
VLFTDEKHAINYQDIVPQEDYCMVVFSLGAMRLDSMSMGNKGTRYPFIGSKLYLDRLIVLRNKEIEAPELPQGDLASLLGKRVRVRVENDETKRAREEWNSWESKIKRKWKDEQEKWMFLHTDTLILGGGGIKSVAYLGALEEMIRQGLDWNSFCSSIKHLAGSSAGSFSAACIGFGLSIEKLNYVLS